LANCASSPDSIAAVPYPDQVFRNMSCEQITAEYLKIESSVAKITPCVSIVVASSDLP